MCARDVASVQKEDKEDMLKFSDCYIVCMMCEIWNTNTAVKIMLLIYRVTNMVALWLKVAI